LSVIQNIRFLAAFNRFTNSITKDGTMKNWMMSILTLIGAAAGIFQPQLAHLIATHPAVFTAVAGAVGIINHVLPSPTGASIDKGQ